MIITQIDTSFLYIIFHPTRHRTTLLVRFLYI